MLERLNDYAFSIYSPSPNYGVSPNFVHVSALDGTGFGSLYLVTKETARAITQTGTTQKFAGCVWSGRLWVDVDSYEKAKEVELRLKEMELNFVMFDSGGKGMHFGVLRQTQPSHLLPLLDKSWVKAHIPEADCSIYTHLHLFRLPGTLHQVTGRPKELVASFQGKSIDVESWKRRVRESDEVQRTFTPTAGKSVFESLRIMANTVPTTMGERHYTMLKAAYGLRDVGVDSYVTRWWVGEINKMCEAPKEEWELNKLVDSVYEQGL